MSCTIITCTPDQSKWKPCVAWICLVEPTHYSVDSICRGRNNAPTTVLCKSRQINLSDGVSCHEAQDLDGSVIFEYGLASLLGKSAALTYLSCFGLACNVRPSLGNEFEKLTALHCHRLFEIHGFVSSQSGFSVSPDKLTGQVYFVGAMIKH